MRLSAQCYTVRDEIEKDLWGTLAAMRKLGLNYIEIGGTFGFPAQEFKDRTAAIGLGLSGNHVSLDRLENNFGQVVAENETLGIKYVVLSSVDKAQYERGWASVAKLLEPIGARLREAGLVLSYHNHAFEFKTENGRPGLDIFYETADPKLVTAQIDTYWVAYGNADPAAYIRKLNGRVPTVHLKDGKLGGAEPYFCEAGEGDLNWDDILAACNESGVEFGAIELDVCPHEPMESLRMSVDYLRSKGVKD